MSNMEEAALLRGHVIAANGATIVFIGFLKIFMAYFPIEIFNLITTKSPCL